MYEQFFDDVKRIPDETYLYRRVDWDKLGGKEKCPKDIQAKLNGNSFTDYPPEKAAQLGYPGPCMSVGVGSVFREEGMDPSAMLRAYPDFGLAKVSAGALRRLTRANGDPCPQGIMLCPTEDEPWHGVVFDLTQGPRKSAVCRQIASRSEWEIPLINHS